MHTVRIPFRSLFLVQLRGYGQGGWVIVHQLDPESIPSAVCEPWDHADACRLIEDRDALQCRLDVEWSRVAEVYEGEPRYLLT